jgi:hypothetical protein
MRDAYCFGHELAQECCRAIWIGNFMQLGRRLLARAWVLALMMVVAVACSNGAEQTTDESTPDAGGGATSEPVSEAASAAPASVSPEEYQQALATLGEELAAGFGEIAKIKKPAGLTEAVANLRGQVDQQRSSVAEVVPPENVAAAHADLDAALLQLSDDLSVLEDEASSGAVCAGGAAVRRAGNSEGAAAVRAAAEGIASADPAAQYTVGSFVPKQEDEKNRRGRNGDLRAGKRGGNGELQISGSPNSDAVIKLREGDESVRNVYVRKGTTVNVNEIPDGNYDVYAAQGVDWNESTGRFTRECIFSHFDDKLEFTTTATTYSVWQLQLTETAFGNAPSSPVDPAEFPD